MTTPNRFAPQTRDNPEGFVTREITLTLDRAARDANDPRIPIAFSSEAPVTRYDWRTGETYDEILVHNPGTVDLSYAKDGLPFCVDHDLSRMVGLLEDVTIDADRVGRGMLRAGSHPDASWVIPDIENGIRKKVSFGYWPGDYYTQTKTADGRIERRFTGWGPYEASTVPVPADYDKAGVGRSARDASASQESPVAGEMPQPLEQRMNDTAQERGSAPAPAQDTRAAELSALATNAKMESRLAGWITNGVTVDAARSEVIASLTASAERAAPIAASAPAITVGAEREADKPWASSSEFFRAVIACQKNGGNTNDVRLTAARNQDTLIGEEGGFAVPMAVANILLEATLTGGDILSRVSQRPITVGNSYSETVVKEEARTNGSRNGGVRHYWLSENGDYVDTVAVTRQVEAKLGKLGALVRLTEEQMQDGPAMESFLNEQVPEELRFGAEAAIWEGDGVAKPLGLMNSGALVSQAIEGSQTIANTAGNIWVNAAKMYARMPARMLPGAAWFINAELWAKILTSTAGTGAGAAPAFIAPGALNGAPNATLYGKPIIPIEYASTEGTVGDFVFANLSDYLFMSKGGIRQQSSIHVDFIRDRTALKFTWRVNGLPRTRVPVTPFKGSVTQSPYIALAARS